MHYSIKDHTFVICAYKESRFLEACIRSLKKQSITTNIIMVTSTPNEYMDALAEKYQIKVYINEGEKGITQDWNFALQCAETKIITIAHQDDIYNEKYAEHVMKAVNSCEKPLLFFSDYAELRHGGIVSSNQLLRVKRIMLAPLKWKCLQKSRFVRRRILSMGSPICCPSVTYVIDNLRKPVFVSGFRSAEDWEAWEKISRLKGSFLYCKKVLMYHRIHEDSETSIIIGDTGRKKEDYEMFCKFWPRWIAKILANFYSSSEKSNELENK